MVKLADVQVTRQITPTYAATDISLNKLMAERKVVDVIGYFTDHGWGVFFQPTNLILDNGDAIGLNGEHDVVYLEGEDGIPNLDEDTILALYKEENPDEDDDDEDD